MAVRALVAISSIDLTYAPNPVLADTRGAVATTPGKNLFERYQILPDGVLFSGMSRNALIQLGHARLFQLGPQDWDAALTAFFEALGRSSLQTVATIKLNRYFSVEDQRPFEALLKEQVRANEFPSIDPEGFGEVSDIASIWTIRWEHGEFNVQAGPQRREQWANFGGLQMKLLEPQFPAVGWAISFFNQQPKEVNLDLEASKRYVSEVLARWETMVEQNVLKVAK